MTAVLTELYPDTDRPDTDRPDTDRHREVITAFADITTEAITSAGLAELLQLVGRKLCAVLRVTRCSAFLRREDGRFQGLAGFSAEGDISPAIIRLIAGTSEDALTAEAVAQRRPVLAADAQHDPRPVRRAMRVWRVRAIIAVPLVFDGEVIGMLYVDDEDAEHSYGEEDVELAELFGRLAALFVRQAQLNSRLAGQTRQLARHKDMLEHLGDLHARLTRAVLEGADIAAVVTLLSDLAGKPVVLFGPDLEVRAWAAPDVFGLTAPPSMPERVRNLPAVRDRMAALDVDGPSATIPPQVALGLSRRHLLCVLMIEGRRAGYLDIVEMGGLLGPVDAKLAEHGATVLSLQVLSEQRQAEAEGQAREAFLSDVLRGSRDPAQLEERAAQFGLDLTRSHVLVRVTADEDAAPDEVLELRRVLVGAAGRLIGCGEPHAVVEPGAVVLLVPMRGAPTPGARRRLHRGFEAVLADVGPATGVRRAVVSSVCRGAADFPAAHREVRDVDALVARLGRSGGVVAVEGLRTLRFVASGSRLDDAVRFATQSLGPLQRTDAECGGDLLGTLRAFLEAGAQVRPTAEALRVHENTVRYRLRRIGEVSGMDVRSFDALLSAQLAFQVLELVGDAEAGPGPGDAEAGPGPGDAEAGPGPGDAEVGPGPGDAEVGPGPGDAEVGRDAEGVESPLTA